MERASSSAQISNVSLVLTTHDELFGRVQFVVKCVFAISGITLFVVGAIFQYRNQTD